MEVDLPGREHCGEILRVRSQQVSVSTEHAGAYFLRGSRSIVIRAVSSMRCHAWANRVTSAASPSNASWPTSSVE